MKRVVLFLLLMATACAQPGGETDGLGIIDGSLAEGSPEAVGVMRLLNDPDTTFETLDLDARLDRRAALALIEHRYGPDGVEGTPDDDPFDAIDEVDAVKWVGPAALARLAEYAAFAGYLPQQGDVLGVFDNVAFTVDEAEAALELVNTATASELDVRVGLDRRAVDGIVAARPIASLTELAAVYYVGPSAMLKIRNDATSTIAPQGGLAAGQACRSTDECGGEMRCYGIPNDGSSEDGQCVDPTPLPGEGADCDRWTPCTGDLLCAGWTLWGEGTCVAPWMAGTFRDETWRRIPDADQAGACGDGCASSTVVVNGLASVPVDITVMADIQHPLGTQLRVTLTDPNGDEAVLWENSDEVGQRLARSFVPSGISRDDAVNGAWTLSVTDTATGGEGYLKGWSLFIVSRWD